MNNPYDDCVHTDKVRYRISALFFERGIRLTVCYLLQCFITGTPTSTSTVLPTTTPRTATSTASTSVKTSGMTVAAVIVFIV